MAYWVLLSFLDPLMPFLNEWRAQRGRLDVVARRLRGELFRLRDNLHSVTKSVIKKDAEPIERMRKIGAFIDELPI